ncbi:Mss4-like protein [Boeremia exigua]|uniref:Mss4-like protein n=1 Tax=Boeremia exigua TaxID=749465 RepID=UPI001E8D2414|nr:Mss4-like protein [Boeremia exigua]KAH6621985.1 Mss4-like protein [Boeremia exigua]
MSEQATPQTAAACVRDSDKSKPYIPRAGVATDGWSNDEEATATCYCGAVQLSFPTSGPGFIQSFLCSCPDCRKLTASLFTTGLIVADTHLSHLRGQSNLKTYAQRATTASGALMTNYFCDTCGTLMYRVAEKVPGCSILRLGTVDDFNLAETKLKPSLEVYVKDRVGWFGGVPGEGVLRFDESPA